MTKKVEVSMGKTLNIGNYESIRIECKLGEEESNLDYNEELHYLYNKCKAFIEEKEAEICGKPTALTRSDDPILVIKEDIKLPTKYSIIKETEKAYLLNDDVFEASAWVPKKAVEIKGSDIEIKEWFKDKVKWEVS